MSRAPRPDHICIIVVTDIDGFVGGHIPALESMFEDLRVGLVTVNFSARHGKCKEFTEAMSIEAFLKGPIAVGYHSHQVARLF